MENDKRPPTKETQSLQSALQEELTTAQGRIDNSQAVLNRRRNKILDKLFPQKDLLARPPLTGDPDHAPSSLLNEEVARAEEIIVVLKRIAEKTNTDLK